MFSLINGQEKYGNKTARHLLPTSMAECQHQTPPNAGGDLEPQELQE